MHQQAAPDLSQRRFMPEIQGLRALAVGLVVMFHLWPRRVPGGFVGVDVFFVISGFLITSHLLREVERSGSIKLGAFYARRARRLLPASLLVLATSAIAAALILPSQLARAALREVIASTFYVENLWLAAKAVTYSASNDTASPVQHYWSLSAEEQFYALWPALILAAVLIGKLLARRRSGDPTASGNPRCAAAIALGALAIASFAHSVALTGSDAAAAYFVTTTRAWEFAAGALASFVVLRWAPRGSVAVWFRWLGMVAIVASAFVISQSTPFPGAIALVPVLGTAAIIVAGGECHQDPLIVASSFRPTQWLGDISYAIYLWHWPLIALAPFVLGRELAWPDKLVVVGLTLTLAHFTRQFVELAFLKGCSRLVGAPLRVLVSTVVAMALIAAAALGRSAWLNNWEQVQLQERLAELASDPCLGSSAALNPGLCGSPFTTPPRAPVSDADSPWVMPHCDPECWSGKRPSKVLALVGDSHAQTLYHALMPVAAANGYGIAIFAKGACPLNLVGRDQIDDEMRPADECGDWAKSTVDALRDLKPDLIISIAYVASTWSDTAAGLRGYHETWAALTSIAPVTVLRDYPRTGGVFSPDCLAKNPGNHEACNVPREVALPQDLAFEAAANAGPKVSRIDLSDVFCDAQRCHPVVGSLPVYWDTDHITGTFARSLVPVLAQRLTLP